MPPIRVVMLLSAKWGLLEMGDDLFRNTLLVKVLPFFALHYIQVRESTCSRSPEDNVG